MNGQNVTVAPCHYPIHLCLPIDIAHPRSIEGFRVKSDNLDWRRSICILDQWETI